MEKKHYHDHHGSSRGLHNNGFVSSLPALPHGSHNSIIASQEKLYRSQNDVYDQRGSQILALPSGDGGPPQLFVASQEIIPIDKPRHIPQKVARGRYPPSKLSSRREGIYDEPYQREGPSHSRRCFYILVVALIASAGLALGIYFGLYFEMPGGGHVSLTGTVVVRNWVWKNVYSQISSPESAFIEKEFCDELRDSVSERSKHEVVSCNVTRLRQGSVIVDFGCELFISGESNDKFMEASSTIRSALSTSTKLDIGLKHIALNGSETSCRPSQFQCSSGHCISSGKVCDKNNDCGDFSDEIGCGSCDMNDVACNNGACLNYRMRCDQEHDCPDGEDEIGCSCSGYRCRDSTCIPNDWKCDKVADCSSADDETSCGSCRADEFQCRDYSCISLTKRCDGIKNCSVDGTDEIGCVTLDADATLKVTYKGQSVPVCASYWKSDWSQQVCNSISQGSLLSSTEAYSESSVGYLHFDTSQSSFLLRSSYQRSTCDSGKVIKIECENLACGQPYSSLLPGQPNLSGGRIAYPGEWPWQVAIEVDGTFKCGASLLAEKWIVTAAHCLTNVKQEKILLKFGSNLRSEEGRGVQTRGAKRVYTHQLFEQRTFKYDIALIELDDEVQYNAYVMPICLSNDILNRATECYHTGWGKNSKDKNPEELHEQKMKIIPTDQCNAANKTSTLVYEHIMICAGYLEGYSTACSGDSGGPLVCRDQNDVWSLVGVSSWGIQNCDSFSVFTKVVSFLDWIDTNMKSS